jgi:hypothetical protein
MFFISSILSFNSFVISLLIKPSLLASIICECSSQAEPFAIVKKCINSLSPFLPQPSAIFDEIETEHLSFDLLTHISRFQGRL